MKKEKPVIASDWWRLCEMPDLGELNNPDLARQNIVDHHFYPHPDGGWRLWAALRGTAAGHLICAWRGDTFESGPWEYESRSPLRRGERGLPSFQKKVLARGHWHEAQLT